MEARAGVQDDTEVIGMGIAWVWIMVETTRSRDTLIGFRIA